MSLEVHYKSPTGQYQAKFSSSEQDPIKDIFEKIAKFEEIFCSNLVCGQCKGENTRLSVREDKEGNKYYERVCNKCFYSFRFGQKKKGQTLFPKHVNGWTKYVANATDDDDESPRTKGGKK